LELLDDHEAYGDPNWNLARVLFGNLDYWRQIYEEYWGIGADELPPHLTVEQWAAARRFDAAAPALGRAALALNLRAANPAAELPVLNPAGLGFVRSILAGYAETPIVRDRLAFDLVDDNLTRLEHAPARCADLLQLVLGQHLDERTASYLSRAARLYILGFEPEAVVMSRAALDVALQERLTDAVMASHTGKQRRRYALDERISAASRIGLFSSEQKEAAHRLRRAGNEAVHLAPAFLVEGVPDALTGIRILADLLVALFHPKEPSPS
jgi:hypothetical protein